MKPSRRTAAPPSAPRVPPAPHAPDPRGAPRFRRRLTPLLALWFATTLVVTLVASLVGGAAAQERLNLLAVDNELVDAAGPYYFIAQGDSANAFARAQPLADALGLDLSFDDASKTLRFSDGRVQARLATTGDILAGLQRRADAFVVDGRPFARPVPMGIVVEGVSYVAVTPLVEAFGGSLQWYPEDRLIAIDSPPEVRGTLPAPRVGIHDDFVRVALDLPAGQHYDLAVKDNAFVVRFPDADTGTFREQLAHDLVSDVSTSVLSGEAALVVRTSYPLSPDGNGYRFAVTPKDNATDIFYVDFSPELRGDSVARMVEPLEAPVALAPAPAQRKVVVIDAGHGGHDPGAVSRYAREEAVVLAVALKVKALVEAEGVEVVMTRDRDTFLALQERAQMASPERNLFVSIHGNSADDSRANGVETFVFGRPLDPKLIETAIKENGGGELGRVRTEEALKATNEIVGSIVKENQLNYSKNLASVVQEQLVAATGSRDRGVKQNALAVLRFARIPAILVEVGFISNPDEGAKLASEAYQTTVARALATGILEFLDHGGTLANN